MNHKQIWQDTFAQVRALTAEAAARLPEERAEYRAVPELMSFRQLLLHILSSYETVMTGWASGQFEWQTRYNDENFPTLAAVREALPLAAQALAEWVEARTPDELEAPVAEFGDAPLLVILQDMVLHEVHHRGQLFIYLRECGVVPPSMY